MPQGIGRGLGGPRPLCSRCYPQPAPCKGHSLETTFIQDPAPQTKDQCGCRDVHIIYFHGPNKQKLIGGTSSLPRGFKSNGKREKWTGNQIARQQRTRSSVGSFLTARGQGDDGVENARAGAKNDDKAVGWAVGWLAPPGCSGRWPSPSTRCSCPSGGKLTGKQ